MAELWQQTLGWCPSAAQQALFQHLYQAVLEGNQRLNLTRITEPQEFWEKHIWDSLSGVQPWLAPALEPQADTPEAAPLSMLDIGTGAGFPGVPVAIALPQHRITLLDSTRKKIAFLEDLSTQLGLTNVRAIANRAETLGHHPQHRAAYDRVLLRAVAPVSVCAEYALPFLRQGGIAVLYRGQWSAEEETTLRAIAPQLGGELKAVLPFQTPLSHSIRHCIQLQKVAPTATQFPRAPGLPRQRPL